jgi:GMP synthase (glutamine-hydrolysing)
MEKITKMQKLKSKIIVQSIIKNCDINFIPVYVEQSGFEDAGAIIVKVIKQDDIFLYNYKNQTFKKIFGIEPVSEQRAIDYLEKEKEIDPDLWVLEIIDKKGLFPFSL